MMLEATRRPTPRRALGIPAALLLLLSMLSPLSAWAATDTWNNVALTPSYDRYVTGPVIADEKGRFYTLQDATYLVLRDTRAGTQTPTSRRSGLPSTIGKGSLKAAPDGRFYVSGGFGDGYAQRSSAFYDPATNTWEELPPWPGSSTGGLDAGNPFIASTGDIYTFGGIGISETTNSDVYRYSPTTKKWEKLPVTAPAYGSHWLTLEDKDGSLIIASGSGSVGGTATRNVYRYDPVGKTWTTLPLLNAAHAKGFIFSGPDGEVIVLGGDSLAIEVLYPGAKSWTTVGSLTRKVYQWSHYQGVGGVVYNRGTNSLFITGIACPPGSEQGGVCTDKAAYQVRRFDVGSGTWTDLPALKNTHTPVSAIANDGRIYVRGVPENVNLTRGPDEYLDTSGFEMTASFVGTDDGHQKATLGSTVTMTYTVKNVSTRAASSATITTPCGGQVSVAVLQPGESTTAAECTFRPSLSELSSDRPSRSWAITATFDGAQSTQRASVTYPADAATPGGGLTISNSPAVIEDSYTDSGEPGVGRVDLGESIVHTFVLTNTGTAAMLAVLSDSQPGLQAAIERAYPNGVTVEPGEHTLQVRWTPTETDLKTSISTSTTASARMKCPEADTSTGCSLGQVPVSGAAVASLAVLEPVRSASIVLSSPASTRHTAGSTGSASFLVKNTGNRTLTGITGKLDGFDGASLKCPSTTLRPVDAAMTCTATSRF